MEYGRNSVKRSIGDLIRMTAIIAFGACQEKYKQPKFLENSAEDSLYLMLLKMIDRGELNEAENILMERIENRNSEDLRMALDIYSYMNEKSDEFLYDNHFEREEIEAGVRYVINQYGYSTVI